MQGVTDVGVTGGIEEVDRRDGPRVRAGEAKRQRAVPEHQADGLGERRLVVRDALGAAGRVGGEPGADLPPELLVSGRVGEVHRRPSVYQHSAPA